MAPNPVSSPHSGACTLLTSTGRAGERVLSRPAEPAPGHPAFTELVLQEANGRFLREKRTLRLSVSQFCLFCKHKELNILLFLVLQSSQNKYLPSKATTVIIITVISSSAVSLTHASLRSKSELCVVCLDNDFHVETSCGKSTGSNFAKSGLLVLRTDSKPNCPKALEHPSQPWLPLSIK